MDIKKNNLLLSNGFSLIPLLVFLVVYISAGIWFALLNEPMAFYQFPAASCAFFGFFAALILGYKNTQEHINTFISSIADSTVILMCLVFLLAGAFSALAKSIGCIDATVNLGIYLLPDRLLLPGLFLVSCFVSFSMGTSMGTISTIMPIAIGFSTSAEISMPLVAATVVGGAMFGDNLSVISDTTIAATSTQECGMREKMVINSKIAFLAAFLVCIILFFMGKSFEKTIIESISLVKIVPYAVAIILAIRGLNVILVLMIGIFSCMFIGLFTDSFHILSLGKIIYNGFMSMADVFFVTFLIAGLAGIAYKEGGVDYLLKKLSPLAKSNKGAQLVIALCVTIADICIANNTVAILFCGSISKKLALQFNVSKAKAASILDIFSCVWQGIIPHGAQILLAGGLCQISGMSIIQYSYYPIILGLLALIEIIFFNIS